MPVIAPEVLSEFGSNIIASFGVIILLTCLFLNFKSSNSKDATNTPISVSNGTTGQSTQSWYIDSNDLEEAVIVTCPKHLIMRVNNAAEEMFQNLFETPSIIGMEFSEVFDIMHSHLDDRMAADAVIETVLQNPSLQYREMLRLTDGRFIERITRPHSEEGCRIWYIHDLTYLMQANEDKALHDTMTQEDAARTAEMAEQLYLTKAELEQNQIELTRLANTDGLTGLNNRRHFMELASDAILDMSSLFEIWVIMLDIDHFKKINDQYGHSAGDAAIRLFSETVKNSIGSRGQIGRMGGEEFAVFIPGVTQEDAQQLAEDIRQSVENLSIVHENISFKFTTSVGIAKVHDEEFSIESALDRADAALYDAKTSGRNCIKAA
ncbi:GGDEF domain-containing protein [Kordiimonas sp. SCSIO 12610]|uniref:sensor domain-containing diguanylate cyclase n=1 Tax=Kordiimonas sp. SCSIO 12610 TaxID=2829597 RepID=UPI00210B7472|nr:GGDEF domain-containing protein [Kordiimonas sp. SCSIO 12610]UTW56657.1 GGDEF domain-containing protein [Kordiimonas sp. SCSIO 12610]